MNRSILTVAFASMLFSGSAFAADVESPTVIDWSGPYLGAFAGYGWGDNDITDEDGFSQNPDGTTISNDVDGFVGGALVGFNVQSNSFVFGIEADAGWSDISGSTDEVDSADFDETASVDYGFLGSLRARAGFAVESFHLYATGGAALADITNELADTDGGIFDPVDSFGDSDTRFGWVAGVGAEWMFSENVIGRVEGLYYDFGDESYTVDAGGTNSQYTVDNTLFVARAALAIKF